MTRKVVSKNLVDWLEIRSSKTTQSINFTTQAFIQILVVTVFVNSTVFCYVRSHFLYLDQRLCCRLRSVLIVVLLT